MRIERVWSPWSKRYIEFATVEYRGPSGRLILAGMEKDAALRMVARLTKKGREARVL